MTIHATAAEAVAASIINNRIAHCQNTEENMTDLLAWCDDSADSAEHEFWGIDDDGNHWRVHVALA